MSQNLFLLCLLFLSRLGHANGVDPIELLKTVDQAHRADSSLATITMEIENPDWKRTMKMKVWSLGTDFTLIKILSPARDKGVSTLRRDKEMWNFFPKINREIKVPPSMMMGSWMGSDFTNDDLVKQSDLVDEYKVSMKEEVGKYRLVLIPKKNTATVWGKIEIIVDKKTKLPDLEIFYDEKGTKVREMAFGDNKVFSGKLLPSKLEVRSLTKKGHKTVVKYDDLQLNAKVTKSFFSLHNLKKVR